VSEKSQTARKTNKGEARTQDLPPRLCGGVNNLGKQANWHGEDLAESLSRSKTLKRSLTE
jgi:hypothetical protein